MSDDFKKARKLIQVQSKKPHYICCSCCDEASEVDSTVWYKELQENERYFEFQTYLECCKNKIGTVVGWCDLEEYERTIGYEKIGEFQLRLIAGYSSK